MPHNVVRKEENLKLMKENPCPPCPCSDAAIIQGIDGCPYPRWRTRERVQPRLLPDSIASAPRFGRRWEQIRMPLIPDSPKVIVLEMVGFR